MRPERMNKISMLVKNSYRPYAIRELARAKVVHVVDHKKEIVSNTSVDIGSPAEASEIISDTLTKTRSLLSKFDYTKGEITEPATLSERIVRINQLAESYADHERSLAIIEEELEKAQTQKELLDMLPDIEGSLQTLFTSERVTCYLVQGDVSKLLVVLDPIFFMTKDETTLIGLKEDHDINDVIKAFGCVKIDFSSLEPFHGTQEEALHKTIEHLVVLEHEQQHATFEMENLAKHTPFLEESEKLLEVELLKAQAPLHFGTTKSVTYIQGYIPVSQIKKIEAAIPDAVINVSPTETAPTKLHNPKIFTSFESLIRLYTLPKYNEIDPTNLMAVTLPVFFGFMLGDIGYGFILLFLFMWLHHTKPALKDFSEIVMISSVSAIIFGALYGEIFGLEVIFGVQLPALVHRMEYVNEFLLLTVAVGFIHVNIGLLLGMYNKAREGWFFAIVEKGSWMLLQAALIVLAAAKGFVPHYTPPEWHGWALMVTAIVGIIYSEGFLAIFELPKVISHILSYTRLAAIGIASVSLAVITNEIGGGLVKNGGLNILWGVLILLSGHTINLALGLLGPMLQSLRLHYVEFFMKFYEGGGEPYVPFGTIKTHG